MFISGPTDSRLINFFSRLKLSILDDENKFFDLNLSTRTVFRWFIYLAVVITNLFSAIPFVGQDLVEFENLDKSSTLSAYYLEFLPIS